MDFKQNLKMKSQIACFKEGGQVYKSRTHKEDPKELAEDKALVKKGIRQHEEAQHKGDPKTEIKLKTGRRVKKDGGVVNKFKKGGSTNVAEKGKPSGDKDLIKKVKEAPKKATAPSKAKVKGKETPGKETGLSGDMDPLMAPPAAGPAAAAPSAAMAAPMDGVQNMASGRRPFFNEEPDDMTAVPTKPRRAMVPKKAAPAPMPMPQQGAVSDAERQQIMDMFQGGPGEVSDYERQMMPSYAPGGMIPDAVTRSGVGGLGNAINTGALGGAGAMGAPRNVPLSPQEMDIMRGLQAVGSYCKGGSAH